MNIDQIKQELSKLPSMAALDPLKFAEEGGLADEFVRQLEGELKPTQLRRVFHQVKDMQLEFKQPAVEFDRAKVALIMPTLAYGVGRRLIPKEFYELMKLCFGQAKCKNKQDFDRAASFLEAIMAYHKYHQKS